jgi:hypothetical protein
LGQAARDFNARGRYCHGAGVERATSFPFDTASIGRTLSLTPEIVEAILNGPHRRAAAGAPAAMVFGGVAGGA